MSLFRICGEKSQSTHPTRAVPQVMVEVVRELTDEKIAYLISNA